MLTIDFAMRVATQLQRENKFAQAEKILKSILEFNPNHAHALHLLGIIAYQSGKFSLGVELIQKAIENEPTIALFHSNLGEIYRQLKSLDLSVEYGQCAVKLDPNSANAWSNLGIAYFDAKYYEEAKACHKQALLIDSKLANSLNNMGSISKIQGNMQEAQEFYEAAIKCSPYLVEPLNNLGVLFLQQQEYSQALRYLEKAIALSPTFADAQCNMGFAWLGLEKHDEAQLHFEKALQLKTNYAEAYFGMAKVYLHKHHFKAAENSIHEAIAIQPKNAEFYQLLAEIFVEQGEHKQALNQLNCAISLDGTLSSLYISKGNILMEMGEVPSAEEQFSKLDKDSILDTRILAHYSLVQLRKVQPNSLHLQALLSMANNIHDVSVSKREYLYFALGKCYDDLGEWAKAFVYYTQGCKLKRKRISYNSAEYLELARRITECFTPQFIEHMREFSNASTLPVFIVGMPRSGTTLVEQILASHPEIFGAGELPYLNDIIQSSDTYPNAKLSYPDNILQFKDTNFRAVTEKYLFSLQGIGNHAKRVTDKMPSNFIALGIIHALFPNAKIIHVKRNPIDTCVSCYTKLFNRGQLYSYDLTELGEYYTGYQRIMDHWRHVLPDSAWLEVDYENLIYNFEAETKRLLAYCGLNWDPACLAFYESKRQVRTASLMQVRQPLYTTSVNRWRRWEKELAPLIKVLSLGIS